MREGKSCLIMDRVATANRNDPQYLAAIGVVVLSRRGATSLIQRGLGISYGDAVILAERMVADGILSTPDEGGKRTVLVSFKQRENA